NRCTTTFLVVDPPNRSSSFEYWIIIVWSACQPSCIITVRTSSVRPMKTSTTAPCGRGSDAVATLRRHVFSFSYGGAPCGLFSFHPAQPAARLSRDRRERSRKFLSGTAHQNQAGPARRAGWRPLTAES